jgi:hypothetical protein
MAIADAPAVKRAGVAVVEDEADKADEKRKKKTATSLQFISNLTLLHTQDDNCICNDVRQLGA